MTALVLAFAVSQASGAAPSGWGLASKLSDNRLSTAAALVAFDAHGNAVAAWMEDAGSGLYHPWASRYIAGLGWSVPTRVDGTANVRACTSPALAVNASGDALLLWLQSDGSRLNLWSSHFDPLFGWDTPALVETDSAGDADGPSVAFDGAGSGLAVWAQSDGTRFNILSNRYTPGTGWGTPELLETDDTGGAGAPKLAVAPAGNATAVWYQDIGTRTGIFSNRDTVGSGWGAAEAVEDLTGSATSPHVGIDGAGNALAVWVQYDGTRDSVYAARISPGTGWGTPALLETNDSEDGATPVIAVSPSGSALAVWLQGPDSLFEPFWSAWGAAFDPASGWGAASLLETNDNGRVHDLSAALDSAGHGVALWTQQKGGGMTESDTWAATFSASSGWGQPQPVETDNAGTTASTAVSTDGSGRFLALWDQATASSIFSLYGNAYLWPDTTPPSVSITAPAANATVDTPTVTVNGTAEPGARLAVNGVQVAVGENGSWRFELALLRGNHTILATATDAAGNSANASILVTFRDPVPGLQAQLASTQAQLNTTRAELASASSNLANAQNQLNNTNETLQQTREQLRSASDAAAGAGALALAALVLGLAGAAAGAIGFLRIRALQTEGKSVAPPATAPPKPPQSA